MSEFVYLSIWLKLCFSIIFGLKKTENFFNLASNSQVTRGPLPLNLRGASQNCTWNGKERNARKMIANASCSCPLKNSKTHFMKIQGLNIFIEVFPTQGCIFSTSWLAKAHLYDKRGRSVGLQVKISSNRYWCLLCLTFGCSQSDTIHENTPLWLAATECKARRTSKSISEYIYLLRSLGGRLGTGA